jgi:2-methylisocitrate lyase-like PEP mutase family enzyme
MVENGATPSWTPEEAQELGFRVMIFPFAAIAPAYEAIRNTFERVKKTGRTGLAADFTPKKLFSIVGLKQATAIDAAAGGELYSRV